MERLDDPLKGRLRDADVSYGRVGKELRGHLHAPIRIDLEQNLVSVRLRLQPRHES